MTDTDSPNTEPEAVTVPLFKPFRLRGLTFRNRIILSPMCQYSAVDGVIEDWHFAHHARFALGGLGGAVVEATGVTKNGRITYGCTGIWDDAQIEGLSQIANLYHSQGIPCGIQLAHAGRRASCARPWDGAAPIDVAAGPEPRWKTVGPSPISEREGYPVPHELTAPEIEEIVTAFANAAQRALSAGFDFVEIHGAHGYLLHSFFSPIANQRNDAFGGSRDRRMQLPLAVARAVRNVWPEDRPLFYRTSCEDGMEGGLTIADTVALAGELGRAGVDLIDCSSGGICGPVALSGQKIKPGYLVPLSEAVRRDTGMATMAVGAIIDPYHANAIVRGGRADLIAIGRELLADPSWAYHAALTLGVDSPHDILPQRYAFYLSRRARILDLNAEPL